MPELISQPFIMAAMTPLQLKTVQETFAKIAEHADQFSALFYERLFEIDPSARPLFHSDMKLQHSMFMKVLGEVVNLHLRSLIFLSVTDKANAVSVIPGAYSSGKLHHGYGVTPQHFETMKVALLEAMAHQLGPDFTSEARDAWSQAYDILSAAMQKGLHEDDEAQAGENGRDREESRGVHEEHEANEVSALFDRLNRR